MINEILKQYFIDNFQIVFTIFLFIEYVAGIFTGILISHIFHSIKKRKEENESKN